MIKRIGHVVLVLSIVALAAWAYDVNYRTKQTLGRIDGLRDQIAAEREALQVLRVEWAYLNAPERLARLVQAHNGTLQLGALAPEQFSRFGTLPFVEDFAPAAEASDTVAAGALQNAEQVAATVGRAQDLDLAEVANDPRLRPPRPRPGRAQP